jgi:predicted Na+-dependent transporter
MMLLVLALGLRSAPGDARYLLARPALLIRSLLAMNVVMPLLVLWLVMAFDLRPPVKIALFALSISPVPPFLPGKQLKLPASQGYTYGLFATTALVAIVLVPLTMTWIGGRVSAEVHIGAAKVLSIVAMTVLIPLAVGIVVRHFAPRAAAQVAPIADKLGSVLLIVAFIPVLIVQWPAMRSLLGDGTLLAIVAFTALGLAVGHLLGGPQPQDRSVLALATASRHPAVALAIAAASFPEQKLVAAAVLLALIVGVLASVPYTAWRKRLHAGGDLGGPTHSPMPGPR